MEYLFIRYSFIQLAWLICLYSLSVSTSNWLLGAREFNQGYCSLLGYVTFAINTNYKIFRMRPDFLLIRDITSSIDSWAVIMDPEHTATVILSLNGQFCWHDGQLYSRYKS